MPDGSALLVLKKAPPFAQSVFRVSLATGQEQRLTFPEEPSAGDIAMAMSPDGRTLAFCRSPLLEGCDLFLMPATGGDARRLTNDLKGILGLAWTADGREIVFASNRLGRFQLWRVAARLTDSTGAYSNPILVQGAGDDARNPTIQNSRLVYQQHRRNFDIRLAEIIGPEGTPKHHVEPSKPLIASTRLDASPSWSPDGKRIAFKSNRAGNEELWVCDADGSNPLKLTSFGGPNVIFPRWSPDGQHIIFSALTAPGGNFESYIIDATGGAPRRIADATHRTMAHAIFSHDGRWIYFVPGAQDGPLEAFRMPAQGGEAVQITHRTALRPEESADRKLLFYSKRDTNGIWSVPISGGEERRVVESIGGLNFNWTVTSEGIYYLVTATGSGARTLVRFYSFKTGKTNEAGTVEGAVSLDFSGISVSPDGRWLLYSHIAEISSDLMMVDHFR
jgi:Tol biopolymer transport system component